MQLLIISYIIQPELPTKKTFYAPKMTCQVKCIDAPWRRALNFQFIKPSKILKLSSQFSSATLTSCNALIMFRTIGTPQYRVAQNKVDKRFL